MKKGVIQKQKGERFEKGVPDFFSQSKIMQILLNYVRYMKQLL